MQDIIFYAAMDGTVGQIRDQANAKKKPAPILTLGPEVCLRMRLFETVNTAAPYPIESFNLITDWQWSMDSDFDRNSACKLVADPGGISVHTVTERVNGRNVSFTEFVIPISNMNTEELAAWLGNAGIKPGLVGELVGYDSEGHTVFVLQIEDFKVRNRISGLCDPTALDQEIVTRTQAERLIRTAVSASADTKQDKLNASNAGTGISISLGGTISTALVAGDLVEISGATVNRKRYMNIMTESAIPTRTITIPNSTATATAYVLEPGNAYKLHVASAAKWLATTAAFKASSVTWGIEGHIELFVAGTGYVRTDSNVVLANALEPDAVNNCTVRFHDGIAIISVEDHIAGYVVTVNAASGSGSLAYGLTTASNEYIAVDASLNGSTLDMAGAVTNGEKHVVGNGYTDTILTGGVSCTSKTTFANLAMQGVSVLDGTAILGDVYIPNGATVSVSGGGLAVEKVTGNGGTIDLNGSNRLTASNSVMRLSGVSIENNTDTSAIYVIAGGSAFLNGVSFRNNTGARGDIYMFGRFVELTGCTVNKAQGHTGEYRFVGSNTLLGTLKTAYSSGDDFSVTVASGATLDLTGNTNAVPIAPGGGVTFAEGGATVYPSAGSASAYVLGGMTVPQLGNTNVVNLNSSNVVISSGGTAYASGCTFAGGFTVESGGALLIGNNQSADIVSCVFSANHGGVVGGAIYCSGYMNLSGVNFVSNTINSSSAAGGAIALKGATVTLVDCDFSENDNRGGTLQIRGASTRESIADVSGCSFGDNQNINILDDGASMVIIGSNHFGGTVYGSGSVTISPGAVIDLTGNTNSVPIAPGGGGITLYGGPFDSGTKIVYGSGSSVESRTFENLEIRGTSITNQGIIYGATVYSHAGDDHGITYTEDSGVTTSEVFVSGETTYVVPGGLVQITNT